LDGDSRIADSVENSSRTSCVLTSIRIIAEQTTEDLQTEIV